MEAPPSQTEEPQEAKPKVCKELRYYYRHREEILEKIRQKRLEDPVYQEKQKAKEEAKNKKVMLEKEKQALKKQEKDEKRRQKLTKLGLSDSPGE